MTPIPDSEQDTIETLRRIERCIASIEKCLTVPKRYSRLWIPDDTCHPFHLTANSNAVPNAEDILFDFRVPSNFIAVFTEYWLTTIIASLFVKSDLSIRIVRASYPRPPFVHAPIEESGLKITGTLQDVYESSGIGSNGQGLSVLEQGVVRPCRIILESGRYSVIVGGTSAGPHTIQAGFNGYTFPSK